MLGSLSADWPHLWFTTTCVNVVGLTDGFPVLRHVCLKRLANCIDMNNEFGVSVGLTNITISKTNVRRRVRVRS